MAGRVQANLAGASNAIAINTASDTTLPAGCRGVYVGGSGNLKVDFVGGATGITYTGIGGEISMQITKIYSAVNGTTATSILALY